MILRLNNNKSRIHFEGLLMIENKANHSIIRSMMCYFIYGTFYGIQTQPRQLNEQMN